MGPGDPGRRPGKLYIVGIGPGTRRDLTLRAWEVISSEAQVILGYRTYIEQLADLLPRSGREVWAFSMGEEVKRCKEAIDLASRGQVVALISGGDPGIYGMAGLALEIMARRQEEIEVEIIPGIPALCAASASLGAPLVQDFAVISLSDLLTSWEEIARRLDLAAQGDWAVVLYNPKSRGRSQQIGLAREILLRHRPPSTPVGIVRRARSEGEVVRLTNLEEMLQYPIDMSTLVIIGSSRTERAGSFLVTSRGYRL